MKISHLDHLVLTVSDIASTVAFYSHILGVECIVFGENRKALTFGQQKINLHERGKTFEPKAGHVRVGSADLCFILDSPLEAAIEELKRQQIPIIEGPVKRTGALGVIESIYIRDPDGNLLELANYVAL